MEKIDWSKAPEGATHWMQESYDWLEGFWKRVGAANYFYEKGEWVFSGGKPFGHPKLIARPSPAWSGVGIPAAGSICEVRQKTPCESSFDWEECRIAMINTGADGLPQVCTIDKRGDLAIYYPATDVVEFRPIRTPEQIAADEREAAVAEMLGLFGGTDSRDTYLMQLLYDAGYRKMEQPK